MRAPSGWRTVILELRSRFCSVFWGGRLSQCHLDSNKVDGFQSGFTNGGCCERLVIACSRQKFGGGGFRVHVALRLFIGTANRSRLGRLERDPLEIDLSISTEAIYADFFSGLYDLTIVFYLL